MRSIGLHPAVLAAVLAGLAASPPARAQEPAAAAAHAPPSPSPAPGASPRATPGGGDRRGRGAGGGHGRHDGATVGQRFRGVKEWQRMFDDPARDAWQKPAELVAALGISRGDVVADLGAGTGY